MCTGLFCLSTYWILLLCINWGILLNRIESQLTFIPKESVSMSNCTLFTHVSIDIIFMFLKKPCVWDVWARQALLPLVWFGERTVFQNRNGMSCNMFASQNHMYKNTTPCVVFLHCQRVLFSFSSSIYKQSVTNYFDTESVAYSYTILSINKYISSTKLYLKKCFILLSVCTCKYLLQKYMCILSYLW